MAEVTNRRNLNPPPPPHLPRVVKRARHNHYRIKQPTDTGTRWYESGHRQLAETRVTALRARIAA